MKWRDFEERVEEKINSQAEFIFSKKGEIFMLKAAAIMFGGFMLAGAAVEFCRWVF